MPTEYPLGKARKASLAASRKAHQERSRRRIIEYMPAIAKAFRESHDVQAQRYDSRTGMVTFRWFGRSVSYSVGKMSMLIYYGHEQAVYSHYTAQQLIDALTYNDPEVSPRFFDTRQDVRLYEGEIKDHE